MGSFYVFLNHHFGHEKTLMNIHDHAHTLLVLWFMVYFTCLVGVQALLNSSQLIVRFPQFSQLLTLFGQLTFKLKDTNLENGRQSFSKSTTTIITDHMKHA